MTTCALLIKRGATVDYQNKVRLILYTYTLSLLKVVLIIKQLLPGNMIHCECIIIQIGCMVTLDDVRHSCTSH